jgi:hypothetical protein
VDEFQERQWGVHRTFWKKRCVGEFTFLKAGQDDHHMSISPLGCAERDVMANAEESDGD